VSPVELGLVVPEGMIDRIILWFRTKVYYGLECRYDIGIGSDIVEEK